MHLHCLTQEERIWRLTSMSEPGSDSDGMPGSSAKFKGISHSRSSAFIGTYGPCSPGASTASLSFLPFNGSGCLYEWTTLLLLYSYFLRLYAHSSSSSTTIMEPEVRSQGMPKSSLGLFCTLYLRNTLKIYLCIACLAERATLRSSRSISIRMGD